MNKNYLKILEFVFSELKGGRQISKKSLLDGVGLSSSYFHSLAKNIYMLEKFITRKTNGSNSK